MKIVTKSILAQLSDDARQNARLRKNYNIHLSDDASCHRLFNAIEPHSYIRPHCHLDIEKDETFVLMSGRLGIVVFTGNGAVVETVELSAAAGNVAADIAHGVFHTAVALEPGTVFFEAKAGPYRQLSVEEVAVWAPSDDDESLVQGFLANLRSLFV